MPREDVISVAGCRTWLQREGQGAPLVWLHGARGA